MLHTRAALLTLRTLSSAWHLAGASVEKLWRMGDRICRQQVVNTLNRPVSGMAASPVGWLHQAIRAMTMAYGSLMLGECCGKAATRHASMSSVDQHLKSLSTISLTAPVLHLLAWPGSPGSASELSAQWSCLPAGTSLPPPPSSQRQHQPCHQGTQPAGCPMFWL